MWQTTCRVEWILFRSVTFRSNCVVLWIAWTGSRKVSHCWTSTPSEWLRSSLSAWFGYCWRKDWYCCLGFGWLMSCFDCLIGMLKSRRISLVRSRNEDLVVLLSRTKRSKALFWVTTSCSGLLNYHLFLIWENLKYILF